MTGNETTINNHARKEELTGLSVVVFSDSSCDLSQGSHFTGNTEPAHKKGQNRTNFSLSGQTNFWRTIVKKKDKFELFVRKTDNLATLAGLGGLLTEAQQLQQRQQMMFLRALPPCLSAKFALPCRNAAELSDCSRRD